MKKATKIYAATSKAGVTRIIRDSREFTHGVFIHTENCDKCSHKCRAEVLYRGSSSTRQAAQRKSIEICREATYTKEVVELDIITTENQKRSI